MNRWIEDTWVVQGNIHLLGDILGGLVIAVIVLGSRPQYRRMTLWPLLMLCGYSSIPYAWNATTPWGLIYHSFFIALAFWATLMLIGDLPTFLPWWVTEFRKGWREGWTKASMQRARRREAKAKLDTMRRDNKAMQIENERLERVNLERERELIDLKAGRREFVRTNEGALVIDDDGFPVTRPVYYPRVLGHEEIR